ncbi:MAG: hypothetical protein IPG84_18245 [Betaproteobacteria bacterium]|nr:hypothetical protein [Betaproteobacteria bacterium]
MPTMDEYLAMMQPDPAETRKQAMWQALGGMGAGLLGGRNWQQGLSRGGLLAYDAMNDANNRASSDKMAQMKMRLAAQEMADKDTAREGEAQFGKQLAGVFSNAPQLGNMGAGGPTPANAAAVAPPDRVEKLRRAAEMYAARGQVKEAQMLMAEAEKMEGTFSVDPKVGLGADGKPQFGQFSNKGLRSAHRAGLHAAAGFADGQPRRRVCPRTQRRGTPGDWAGIGLDREKFGYQQSADKVTTGQKAGDLVSGLRKEFNALQPVQNYRAALPVVESAKNAPDTPAGDLDLIYAVGKALDPNSVVREGELNLVIKSGSPLQRFAGYAQYIGAGKGRLPAAQRAELIAMLDGRVGQLKGAHDMAAAPYIKQAQALGLPMDQIFQEEKSSSKAIRSGGPAVGTVVDGHRFKGGDPNNQANWERMK